MQSWEKEIQDRQQAQKDHIEKSIDFSCDRAIYDEIEKARSGIYTDTYQNRKAGLVGQKYGSEKKITGDDLDAKLQAQKSRNMRPLTKLYLCLHCSCHKFVNLSESIFRDY